jgi:hypothetical protein
VRRRRRWEDDIKIDLGELRCEVMECTELTQDNVHL